LNCKEISLDRVILRECFLSADRFYFLVARKSFDFRFLQHINLSKNNLNDLGGTYLLYLLDTYSTKLEYLNLSYNKIGKQSLDYITHILTKNTLKLYSLNISGNMINDKSFSEICLGVSKNSYLNKLFAAENELGKISSIILGTILKYDKKLKTLDVSKNLIDDNLIGFLLKGLISNSCLEVLILNENNLTSKSLRILETTLHINQTLKELFLEKNKLNNKSCPIISDILNKNKYIEYISLVGNKVDNDGIDLILERQRKIPIKIIPKTDYFQTKLNLEEKINFYEYL
jgi:Ran GTPase-activating protein (RanGAP) involved in mRNA processing and transport